MSSDPPKDVTIGELWRAQQTLMGQLTQVAQKLDNLPDRIMTSTSWNSVNSRVKRVEDWRDETAPLVLLLQERVALLQRLVYGTVGATLLAVVAAVLPHWP